MARAVDLAVAEHRKLGNPIVYWKDGRLVKEFADGSIVPIERASDSANGSGSTTK